MDKKNVLFFVISLLLYTIPSRCQVPHLYTLQQGLKSSYIESVYVDDKNFVWVSTANSLEMFNGHRFVEIDYIDSEEGRKLFNQANKVSQIDDRRYWILTKNGLFIYDITHNDFTKVNISQDNIVNNSCNLTNSLPYPNSDKTLFATDGFGFFVVDNTSLIPDTVLSSKLTSLIAESYIYSILIDRNNRLWISHPQNKVSVIDLSSQKKVSVDFDSNAQSLLSSSHVTSFAEDNSSGKIYMALSHKGILVYDRSTKTVRELKENNRNLYCNCIIQKKSGEIYVGTDNLGIYQINGTNEHLSPYKEIDDIDLHTAKIHSLAEDVDGNLIAGIFQKGVLVLPKTNIGFSYHSLSANANGKNSACVTSFCTDQSGNLWAGTDGCGVFVNGTRKSDGLQSLLIQSILCDKEGRIWCGSWQGGISCCSDGTHFTIPSFLSSYSNTNVMDLAYDPKSNELYAGTNGNGVLRINLSEQSVRRINSSSFPFVNKLFFDKDGILWIGGDPVGLYRYDPKIDKDERVELNSIRIKVFSIIENGDQILLGTENGVICYDKQKKECISPDYLENVPTDITVKNIQQIDNLIWISSTRKIFCIDKKNGKTTVFESLNGHYIGEFHQNASVLLPDGSFCFGGDNGYLSFKPNQLMNLPHDIKNVYISPLWIGSSLDGSDSYHISFCVPELAMQDRICYRYILDGYEKNWHETESSSPEAYYASLPSGSYTFRVQAYYRDNPDKYTEKTLKVNVPYPWYATWWAYLLYLTIASVIGYIIYQNIKDRRHARHLLRKAREKERIKEDKLRLFTSIAHELRSPLTMIISPLRQLTISDQNLDRQANYSIMQRNCNRLLRTVNQMLDVRKIDSGQFHLHFSETELNTYTREVMESFKGVAASKALEFSHESNEESIPIWIDPIHFEKVLFNILSNALKFTPANGRVIVRTSSNENIPDSESKRMLNDPRVTDYAEIRIYNSGSHLNDEDLPHIWERFYQSSNHSGKTGSGIGMNLAYDLVKLHHGLIEAHNVGEDGVEFIVRLPLGKAHLSESELEPRVTKDPEFTVLPEPLPSSSESDDKENDEELYEPLPSESSKPTSDETIEEPLDETIEEPLDETDLPDTEPENTESNSEFYNSSEISVLIVDDDKELCDYVASEIGKEYKVMTANSGNAAWKLILTGRPSIVVTDLMMPDGDGYDLCRRIKANPETDYIAVIVLTSESNEDTQLRTMALQADHFLPKPFNLPLLRSAITQVLRVRESIRNKMRRTEIGNNYGSIEVDSYEDQFIQRVRDLVLKHIDDTTFNVNELSKEIGMSRVHLNRKLKEHFGISPIAYIRSVRLKQAAYLLVNNKVNISEVAYRVGFSSHSYFTSIFHDFFGMSPKEFVATYADNLNDETLQKLLE